MINWPKVNSEFTLGGVYFRVDTSASMIVTSCDDVGKSVDSRSSTETSFQIQVESIEDGSRAVQLCRIPMSLKDLPAVCLLSRRY